MFIRWLPPWWLGEWWWWDSLVTPPPAGRSPPPTPPPPAGPCVRCLLGQQRIPCVPPWVEQHHLPVRRSYARCSTAMTISVPVRIAVRAASARHSSGGAGISRLHPHTPHPTRAQFAAGLYNSWMRHKKKFGISEKKHPCWQGKAAVDIKASLHQPCLAQTQFPPLCMGWARA